MKKLLALLLLVSVFGCETSTKKNKEKPVVVEEPVKEVEVKKEIEKKVEIVDNTLFSLDKKACSGDCPVFSVTVTKDGTMTYDGKKYTNIKGVHTISLSTDQLERFNKLLENAGFAELDSSYTASGTKDFSESVLKHDGKEVTVRLWKDAPKELTGVYIFIEDILYDLKYLE